MKNNTRLVIVCTAIFLAMLGMQSCTSYKGIANKPDGHNRYHPDYALNNLFKKHNSNYAKHGVTDTKASANTVTKPAAVADSINPKAPADLSSMTASSSNEVPVLKNAKDIYKILTAEERVQAKEELNRVFAKRPILKTLVNSRLDKLNEKYPAATQSSARDGGGSLSLGEILSIVAIACSVTWILGLAGLIIGIIALQKINAEGGANWARILAIVAIVLGAIDVLTFILWLLLLIVGLHL